MAADAIRIVSVIAPCRNERAAVDAFCDAVAAQQLPAGLQLEVLVADGRSDDGTREILGRRAAADPRFRLVDNPGLIVSTGLNAALALAQGEVIVRMDLHTRYAPDYIACCLATLEHTGADNVGGPWRAEGKGRWGQAIAAAFQSRWAAGGARSRDLAYEGEVDTVYLGCWPRASFERFGGFDEALVRNQDDEHNLRLRLAGARIWQSASIRSTYTPRDALGPLWRQWLQYGYWKPFVMKKHGRPASWRHLAPGAWVAMLVLTVAALPLGLPWVWPALLAGGFAAGVGTLALLVRRRAGWALWPRVAAVIAAQQLAYGIGSIVGAWDLLRHGRGRARFARLTR